MIRSYYTLFFSLLFVSSYGQGNAAKGDHYLLPEFAQGTVLFKKGNQDMKMLNYNVLSEELVFKNQGRILAVPKEQLQRIDTVFIGDRRFVVLEDKIVELLQHSAGNVYVEYRCNLVEKGKDVGLGGTSETSAVNTPAGIRLGGFIYNMQLPEGYDTKRYSFYWLTNDGKLKQVVNMKQLKKLYKAKGDLFTDYLKEYDVNFEDQKMIVQLIEYLESN